MKLVRSMIAPLVVVVFCTSGPWPAFAQDRGRHLSETASGPTDAISSDAAQTALDFKTSPSITGPTYQDPVTSMEFVFVKGGCFRMGDIDGTGRDNERPVHEVCVDDFYMGKYEVTQGQWMSIMGSNPSKGKTGNEYPVNEISWSTAATFASQLESRTGVHYRLPTEAEWEYAARSGGRNDKWPGTNIEMELKDYAWYSSLKEREIHPVGLKKPNELGLYDVAGNVKEWVEDWYDDQYYAGSSKQNPRGPYSHIIRSWSNTYERKVIRGGYYDNNASRIRSSYRDNHGVNRRHKEIGFRLAIQITAEPTEFSSIMFHPPIQTGSRVRIRYSQGRDHFIVKKILPDGLMVKGDDEGIASPILIRYSEMDSLEVSIPRTPGQGAVRGVGIGAGIGAALGAVAVATGAIEVSAFGLGEIGAIVSVGSVLAAGAAIAALVGTSVGKNEPGDRWEEVTHVERYVYNQAGANTIVHNQQGYSDKQPDTSEAVLSQAI